MDYYLILGIEPSATQDEIKQAYRMMSLKYHPDKNKGDRYFEERFKDIQEAYSTLFDIEKRKFYDYKILEQSRSWKSKGSENEPNSSNAPISDLKKNFNPEIKKVKKNYLLYLIIPLLIVIGVGIYKENVRRYENEQYENLVELGKQNQSINQNPSDIIIIEESSLKKAKDEAVKLRHKSINTASAPKNKNKFGKYISNNTYLKPNSSIDFVKLDWDLYDSDSEKIISHISVKNKTDETITRINVSYEVFNSKNIPINSGHFVINDGFGYGSNKSFLDILEPQKTFEFQVIDYKSPHKNSNDILVLEIENYETQ